MTPKTLLFASSNEGKLVEVREIAASFSFRVLTPLELQEEASLFSGLHSPEGTIPEVKESADSYLGNARLKAEAFYNWSGMASLADDAGLEVDALGGAPGVFSSRYAGLRASSPDNIQKLLAALAEAKDRSARFRSVLLLKLNKTQELIAEATLSGVIAEQVDGSGGFGYDSVFVVDGYAKTLARLKEERVVVKTHRILALEQLFRSLLAL